MFVETLRVALESDYEVVAQPSDAAAVLTVIDRYTADCLLLDVVLPGRNGLDLIPDVCARQPSLKILVVTMLRDRVVADAAFHSGAQGFVPKDASLSELTHAIAEVLAGRLYMSPLVPKSSHLMGVRARLGLERLTPRQHEIFLLFGEAKSETEIANELGLSMAAVYFHKKNVMRALGLTSEAALVRYSVLFNTSIPQSACCTHRLRRTVVAHPRRESVPAPSPSRLP